jgi:hypothetical protein
MKNMTKVLLVFVVGLFIASPAFADMATKDECIAKCKLAAEMLIQDKAAGIAEIGKKDGKFVWKDTYVFLMDLDGKMLAHPIKPALTEKGSLLAIPDKNKDNPKMLFAEFVEVAKKSGEGWVQYMWPKPGEEAPSPKDTYIYRVPGTDMFLGAGIYQ